MELAGPAGRLRIAAAIDEDVPEGSVFVPYAYAGVDLNRLGAPTGAGLKVRAARATAPAGAKV
jgi:hypothetical protein